MEVGPLRGVRAPPPVGAEAAAAAAAVAAVVSSVGQQPGAVSASQRDVPSPLGSPPQHGSPPRFSSAWRDSTPLTPETIAVDESFGFMTRSIAASCSTIDSPWRSSASVSHSVGLGPCRSRPNPSGLAVSLAGSRVPERRGSSVHEGGGPRSPEKPFLAAEHLQKFESLEGQVLAQVSQLERQHAAQQREADRFLDFAAKNIEVRLDAGEERQVSLEKQVQELSIRSFDTSDMVAMVKSMGKEQRIQEQRLAALEATMADTIAELAWRRESDGNSEGELVQQRLKILEDSNAALCEAAAVLSPLDLRLQALEEAAWSSSSSGDSALMAVQELEGLVRQELKLMYTWSQDLVDERVILPLGRVEQKLSEHEEKVAQWVEAGQACSSRLEEHEFRLGVTRTKLEVHDQKLVIMDRNLRWNRRPDAETDRSERSALDSPRAAKHWPQKI